MNKTDLTNLIANSQISLPKNTDAVIIAELGHYKQIKKLFKNQYDTLFRALVEDSVSSVMRLTNGCTYAYLSHETVVFLLHSGEKSPDPYMNYNVQAMAADMSARLTLEFNSNLIYYITLYDQTAQDNLDIEEVKERLNTFWKLYEMKVTFTAKAFGASKADCMDILEFYQNMHITKSSEELAKFHGIPVVGKSNKEVRAALFDAGFPWEWELPQTKFGIGFTNEKGTIAANTMMFPHANKLSKKTAIRNSKSKTDSES